jgi:hypothetical protein
MWRAGSDEILARAAHFEGFAIRERESYEWWRNGNAMRGLGGR